MNRFTLISLILFCFFSCKKNTHDLASTIQKQKENIGVHKSNTTVLINRDLKYAQYSENFEVSTKNHSVKLPWTNVSKEETENGSTKLKFDNGVRVLILDESYNINISELYKTIDGLYKYPSPSNTETSLYSSYYKILNTTISDLEKQTNNTSILAASLTLIVKNNFYKDSVSTTTFSFQSDRVFGFQFGGPTYSETTVLELFHDHNSYITIYVISNTVSQNEIDYIINNVTKQN